MAAIETNGWTIERRKEANGDSVVSITRPDWSVRVAGQFDELLGVAEVHARIYFKSCPIVGHNSCIDYLSSASQDEHFAAAVALGMAYVSQLEAELSGEEEEPAGAAIESEAA